MKKSLFAAILFITVLGGILRLYRLGEVPNSLHRDEAFLGYNAFSILNTGKDMSGNLFPLHFQSFLYSPAGYSYFAIPFIKLFDLNAFSVRFPSALFGTLTIPLAFLLTLSLLKKRNAAILSSLFLAISPWHINLSRLTTENTLVVIFITLGVYLYLLWLQKPSLTKLLITFASFALTLTIYQGPRAFLPIFIPLLALTLGFPKNQFRNLVFLYFLVILLPLVLILASPQLSLRLKTVSIFADTGTQLILDEQIREDGVSIVKKPLTKIFHNKFVSYTNQFLANYFSHFTYDFLFTDKGYPERYRIPGNGLLYLFELPLFVIGVLSLTRQKKREGLLLLGWAAMAPLGSALTFDDVPNLQRTLLIFPALSIVIASGTGQLLDLSLKKKNWLVSIGLITLTLLGIYNFAFYLHQYYIHAPIHKPWFRNEGYRELVSEVNKRLPNYKKAVITTRESAPTIFFLFFSKYDPRSFQSETSSPAPRDLDRINFAKYEFSQEECPLRLTQQTDPATGLTSQRLTGIPQVLYVNFGTCKTPPGTIELGEIKRDDNSGVFKILTIK